MNSSNNARTCWSTPVARVCAWGGPNGGADAKPDVDFVAPLLRRRLSPLARAALHVAHACAGDLPQVRFVYASRHGELGRTLELFQAIAADEPLSPTTFSLSVLNSAPGIYSIARGDRSPATAVAAGDESFGLGLLEAHARAELEPGAPVLYVYADAPAPAPLGPQADDVEDVLAVALLLAPGADRHLRSERGSGPSAAADGACQAGAFLRCLPDGAASWNSPQANWRWEWA